MYRPPLALLLVTVLFAAPVCAQENDLVERGLREYSAGQYAQAISHLSTAVANHPYDDLAHYHLANALLRIGHTQHALQEYSRAYECAQSDELAQNCYVVLSTYRQPIPARSSAHRLRQRSQMKPYTTGSLEQFNNMAAGHSSNRERQSESSVTGVEVFKASPENADGMKFKWDRWIEDYRINFNTMLGQVMRGGHLSGRTKMIFSVDSNHKLRGRILETNAPEFVTDSLLATTREMDGKSALSFPSGSSIPGFNFTMTYSYGAPRYDTNTSASLRSTNANLLNPRGQQAVAGSLGAPNVNGTLSSSDVNGKIRSSQTSAALGARGTAAELRGTAAGLHGEEVGGIPLPQIDTNVSGLILPKAKQVELKATPKLLEPPPINIKKH